MSEWITTFIEAIPTFRIPTRNRPSALAAAIREASRTITNQTAVIQQLTAAGLEATSTSRLLSLSRALQTEGLSPLGRETTQLLTHSTTATIQQMEAIFGRDRLNAPSGWSEATSRVAGLTKPVTGPQVAAALSEITAAVQKAHQTLACREQKTVTNDLRSVLIARGYTVHLAEAHAHHTNRMKVKKGEHVIAARIADTGALELDLAGFEAGQCTVEREAIVHELEQRGYQLRIGQRVVHNRREGGELVKTIEKEFHEMDERLRRLNLAKAQRSRRVRR
jgi:hypothetical protein